MFDFLSFFRGHGTPSAALWAAVVLLCIPTAATAQRFEVIAPTGRWVTDQGEFLSTAEERQLERKLATYEDTTSTQIIVVTLPNLGGVDPGEYATALGREWGVGQKGQNNGVVILASRDDRKVFIATGYGIEGAIPDAVAGRIIRSIIVPSFREGRYYDGFSRAADALILAAAGEFEATAQPRYSEPGPDFLGVIFWVVILIVILLSRSGRGGGGKRYRSRQHGDLPLILWGSILNDALRQGQRGGGFGGGSGGFGGFGGGGGFGGFGGGGGSFGGGGAGGSW